jgi:hypothetical protein
MHISLAMKRRNMLFRIGSSLRVPSLRRERSGHQEQQQQRHARAWEGEALAGWLVLPFFVDDCHPHPQLVRAPSTALAMNDFHPLLSFRFSSINNTQIFMKDTYFSFEY